MSELLNHSLIRLEHVEKSFNDEHLVFRNLSLSIEPGEFVSIIGPSGCGKSTILKLIAQLEHPTSGIVSTPFTNGHHSGDVAYVFQEPTLMPWSNVFDNVWLPLRLKGLSRTKAAPAVLDALEVVGLTDFAAALPNQLSGGMRMRVSIARAFVTKPRVLLMDEPFAALDEISRSHMADDLLKTWESSGASIVLITHNVSDAVYLSQRVLVMTNRPTRVFQDIRINLPYPRQENLRLSMPYIEQVSQLGAALSTASHAANEASA